MKQFNLLEKWYQSVYIISSPLSIQQLVPRERITLIYNTFTAFFGSKFFDVKPNSDKPIEKISWIFSLLSNFNKIGCIVALHEIARLIEYANTLEKPIQLELNNLKKNPQNLRTFFFELFVFKRFDDNQIPNKKKYLMGAQMIEGSCVIDNREYLFECRKIFMPKISELDIMRRLMIDFWKHATKTTKGIGMICTVSFKKPITGKHRSNFENRIKVFFEKLNNKTYVTNINYHITDDYGTFKVIDYNEASLFEIKEFKKYDILYYVIPPKIPVPNQPNKYNAKIICNFSTFQSKIYEKLENVLKEKKQQHKNSTLTNKILFIDSETLPEFHMGLFQNEAMFEKDKVAAIFKKLKINDIVCIIRRSYSKEKPEILLDAFSNENNRNTVKILKEIFR